MEKTRLKELLTELQDELDGADSVGPEAAAMLRDAAAEIDAVLEKSAERDDEDESLGDRLNQSIVELESSHPKVAFLLERIAKALSDMGI